MNRLLLLSLLLFMASACSTQVQRLDLRNTRLPLEARRWLADTEDEVAIARARVHDADIALHEQLSRRKHLDKKPFESGKSTIPEGKAASKAFATYANERVSLLELELEACIKAQSLAQQRLTQARAETAVRYDLAIYEMEPIEIEVNRLKTSVGEIKHAVELQRSKVESAADNAWLAYTRFVEKGGVTNALWRTP